MDGAKQGHKFDKNKSNRQRKGPNKHKTSTMCGPRADVTLGLIKLTELNMCETYDV